MQVPDDYQIPDSPDEGRMDAAYLRTCLGLRGKPGEPPPELPDPVRRAYFKAAHLLSILGVNGPAGIGPQMLATVVMCAELEGVEIKVEEPAYSFPFKDAERGQKVVIHWRKGDRPAHFLDVDTKNHRIIVLHDGNERSIRPDLVRFPEEGEFPRVADNINQPAGA